MGLGAAVLTDSMTEELRAPSNLKKKVFLAVRLSLPCQLTPVFTLCCPRHMYCIQGKFMGLYVLYMGVNG